MNTDRKVTAAFGIFSLVLGISLCSRSGLTQEFRVSRVAATNCNAESSKTAAPTCADQCIPVLSKIPLISHWFRTSSNSQTAKNPCDVLCSSDRECRVACNHSPTGSEAYLACKSPNSSAQVSECNGNRCTVDRQLAMGPICCPDRVCGSQPPATSVPGLGQIFTFITADNGLEFDFNLDASQPATESNCVAERSEKCCDSACDSRPGRSATANQAIALIDHPLFDPLVGLITDKAKLEMALEMREELDELKENFLGELLEAKTANIELQAKIAVAHVRHELAKELKEAVAENMKLKAHLELASERAEIQKAAAKIALENESLKTRIAGLEKELIEARNLASRPLPPSPYAVPQTIRK